MIALDCCLTVVRIGVGAAVYDSRPIEGLLLGTGRGCIVLFLGGLHLPSMLQIHLRMLQEVLSILQLLLLLR